MSILTITKRGKKMDKKQFINTYKPKTKNHKNGALVTTFKKDKKGNYPLATELKKLFPNGFNKKGGK
tara:strand:+ start:627 stop:827 length:201 start_codon:yes stop_codon:yes gene_type:complete